MLLLRSASVERVRSISGTDGARLRAIRQELVQGELPDQLLSRGAGVAFVREFPHGALLYLLVRALRPGRVVETGVRPGYTTMWILGALAANGRGELTSLGPGSPAGRAAGVQDVPVGQFVAPALRDRWTLALGNTPEHLDRILDEGPPVDLFLHDNGSEADRTRSELHSAWTHLGPRGVLLAHRIDANPVWEQFCRMQGVADGVLDPGPPPIGALTVRRP